VRLCTGRAEFNDSVVSDRSRSTITWLVPVHVDTYQSVFEKILATGVLRAVIATVAAKSIRTRAVSPCISSVTDRFSPALNSAKNCES
jgi:hypothetical protein